MSSGSQNLPLIRLENRVEQLKRAISISSSDKVDVTTTGLYKIMSAPTTSSAGGNVNAFAADIINGIFISTASAAVTLFFGTGAQIEALLPANSPIGITFQFTVINAGSSSGTITLGTAPAGLTFHSSVAATTIGINTSRTFLFRKTGSNAFDVYTISTS
jgi:hypothetical protein